MSEAKCHKCGRTPAGGFHLVRVNEKGVEGIWKCTPQCGMVLYRPNALVRLIKGDTDG